MSYGVYAIQDLPKLSVMFSEAYFSSNMDMDSPTNTVEEEHLQVEKADDSCMFDYFEIVPLARDPHGHCTTNDVKQEPLPVEETDDSHGLKLTDVVSLAIDTDGSYTTECVSGDWSAEVKQENLAVVKQEPDDVCCVIRVSWQKITIHWSLFHLFIVSC